MQNLITDQKIRNYLSPNHLILPYINIYYTQNILIKSLNLQIHQMSKNFLEATLSDNKVIGLFHVCTYRMSQ